MGIPDLLVLRTHVVCSDPDGRGPCAHVLRAPRTATMKQGPQPPFCPRFVRETCPCRMVQAKDSMFLLSLGSHVHLPCRALALHFHSKEWPSWGQDGVVADLDMELIVVMGTHSVCVQMCACAHVSLCLCASVCLQGHTCICLCVSCVGTPLCVCLCTPVCARTFARISVHAHIDVYVCALHRCTHVHVYLCVHVHASMCVCVCM